MGNKLNEIRERIMKINQMMARDQLEQRIVEFIKSHDMCVLATSKDDIPRATPIWYNSKGTTLYMVADEGTTKLDNIRVNPRVSIGMHDPRPSAKSIKGIQITGEAMLITEGNPEFEEALRIYQLQERTKRVTRELAELVGMEPPEEMGETKLPKDVTIIKVEAKKIAFIETALLQRGYAAEQVWEARES